MLVIRKISQHTNRKNYEFINGDICNPKIINDLIGNFKPNIIVNFAAESHVDRSITGPMPFVQTNIVGTAVCWRLP